MFFQVICSIFSSIIKINRIIYINQHRNVYLKNIDINV